MARKRDTPSDALLRMVITGLETSDEPPPRKAKPGTPDKFRAAHDKLRAIAQKAALLEYRVAMVSLVEWGPLLCTPTGDHDDQTILSVRAEVLALLRHAVHVRTSPEVAYGIALHHAPQFGVTLDGPRAQVKVTTSFRDCVVLQLLWVLEHVGIGQVRACAAADCARLYVKTYRREFCSLRCQRRTLKQRERHAKREKRDQQQRQRARRRRALSERG